MTNEAVLLKEVALPVSYTVADSGGIEKGTLLKMADLNTAAASDAINDMIAGVAAQEKISLNGQTKLAVYNRGDFRVMEQLTGWFTLFMILGFFVLVLFLSREIVTWYLKQNEIVQLLKEIREILSGKI